MGKRSINWGPITRRARLAAAFIPVAGFVYFIGSSYDRSDDEINLVMNRDTVQQVDTDYSGADLAFGWNERVAALPGDPTYLLIEAEIGDTEKDSPPLKVEFEYQLLYTEGDDRNQRHIRDYQNLHDHFDFSSAWFVNARGANGVKISDYMNDLATETMEELITAVRNGEIEAFDTSFESAFSLELNEKIDDLNWPIKISNVKLLEGAGLLNENVEPQVAINSENKVQNNIEFSSAEFGEDIREFFETMRAANYPDEIISEMYCMYLSEKASREGRSMDMDCMRSNEIHVADEAPDFQPE